MPDQSFINIIQKENLNRSDLIAMLSAQGENERALFERAREIKKSCVEEIVYFRGLIEISNYCAKNCFYCGIRRDNKKVQRYSVSDEEILEAVNFSMDSRYGSIVMQAGELSGASFTRRITDLLRKIKKSGDELPGITLSLGEQSYDTYREWREAGADRYLLRIETSNREIYREIHPSDDLHNFDRRLNCLRDLRSLGYQTGTGVMIGLPFQTVEHLADDLLFMKEMDVDMIGMGPYIEHKDTPLYKFRDRLWPLDERFRMSLKMIAGLRILMKDVNIAAATAMQAIDPVGREKAINIGANVIMPNVTPGKYRNDYKLYENKPCTDEAASDCVQCLEMRIGITGHQIGYDKRGDSKHFQNRNIRG